MRPKDDIVFRDELVDRVIEDRERVVEQIVRSRTAIEQSRELIVRIDRALTLTEKNKTSADLRNKPST